jgi:hypothetical protein
VCQWRSTLWSCPLWATVAARHLRYTLISKGLAQPSEHPAGGQSPAVGRHRRAQVGKATRATASLHGWACLLS